MAHNRYDAKEYLAKRLLRQKPPANWIGLLFPNLTYCRCVVPVETLYPNSEKGDSK